MKTIQDGSKTDKRKSAAREALELWWRGETFMSPADVRHRLKSATNSRIFSGNFTPTAAELEAARAGINRGNEEALLKRAVEVVITTPQGHAAEYKAAKRREAATLLWIIENPAHA